MIVRPSLVELDPTEHKSGGFVHRRTKISKRADGFVSKILIQGHFGGSAVQPGCKGRRLKETGKPE